MSEFFTSEFFAGNRERLRQLFTGTAPIVITANGLLQRNGDMAFPFRQDSSFWYLTGVNYPDVILVIDKDKEYFIVPERDYFREAFDGAIHPEELQRISGVQMVVDDTEGWRLLSGRLKRAKHVATLGAAPAYADWHGFYSNPARATLISKLKSYNDDLEVLDLREHLMSLRAIKQAPELAAIQEAIDVTIAGIKYVTTPSRLVKYATENEIEADLSRSFRRAGYHHAFDPIVASGPRACQIHAVANDGVLSADELLMFDVGAEVSNYAADVSRTIALGNPSKRQQAVFKAVLDAQAYAFSLLKPGADYQEYETAMEVMLGEKLRELGLIKSIERDSVRHYFPHRTSHFLGLDAHDVGDYEGVFGPGMVLAVEPGIYIPEEGIGVRIEDDVLITETGIEVLSSALSRALVSPTMK
jgi:Xaa-Pro aminopeptidase